MPEPKSLKEYLDACNEVSSAQHLTRSSVKIDSLLDFTAMEGNADMSVPAAAYLQLHAPQVNSFEKHPLPTGGQIKHLCLGNYGFELEPGQLPEGIEFLHLGSYNHPLKPGDLPESLLDLDLGMYYNHPLDPATFPKKLRSLQLSYDFNHPIESGQIPETVTEFATGLRFNHPLGEKVLPDGLVVFRMIPHPTLVADFNSPVVFPPSLKLVRLNDRFNQPLDLSEGLEELVLSTAYRRLPEKLPSTLKSLVLGKGFTDPITELPPSLIRVETDTDKQLELLPKGWVDDEDHEAASNEQLELIRAMFRKEGFLGPKA